MSMTSKEPPTAMAGISGDAFDRVRKCKDEMISLCVSEIKRSQLSPEAFFGKAYRQRSDGDFLAVLESYLQMDEEVMAELDESHVQQLQEIVDRATAELESLLAETEREQLRAHGIYPLLAQVDYAGMAEFFCQMNGLPSSGRHEGNYQDLFCPKPFEYAEISSGGNTFVCCPLQLPTVVGNPSEGTFMDVWNSKKAQEIRGSILDGSFSHCIEKTCGELQKRTLPKRDSVTDPYFRDIIDNNRTKLDKGPKTIFMNYDRSCNLACPSCRIDLITIKGKSKEEARRVQEWATADHLKDAERLHITGSGDALGSHIFHSFLRQFNSQERPQLRISIGTNGLLFTEKTWDRICKDAIDIVVVSADAASQPTYTLNRGGDFSVLVENLNFIGRLRSAGELKFFGITFVVQANNFHEMPAFVKLGQAVNADTVCFQQLTNWGTFSVEEFQRRTVHRPSHPQHEEFLEVLNDPILGLPFVDLYNLSATRQEVESRDR